MLVCSTTISNNAAVNIAEVLYLLTVVLKIIQEMNDHELSYISFSNNIHIELAHYLLGIDG